MAVRHVALLLAGDVMTGRGIDQILPHPGDPALRESYVTDARDYVAFCERIHGAIPRPVSPEYIWGETIEECRQAGVDVRIVNLETSISSTGEYWAGKGIHYRMHPQNVGCLSAAHIDVCTLANNHVLDFGRPGLLETLEALSRAGIATTGAGRTAGQAAAPADVPLPGGGRVRVVACCFEDSGVPPSWAASATEPGVNLLPAIDSQAAAEFVEGITRVKRQGDIVVVSVHWGANWGYDVPQGHVTFAHALVDAGVDVLLGHSSHHPRPIEIYRRRLVIYGAGDLINDYEGIEGYEQFRGDLALLYLPSVDGANGTLTGLLLVPLQIRRMRLERARRGDAQWLCDTINHMSGRFGVGARLRNDDRIEVHLP